MVEKQKKLAGAGIILLSSIIAIPLTVNAISALNSGSTNNSGTIVDIISSGNSASGYIGSGSSGSGYIGSGSSGSGYVGSGSSGSGYIGSGNLNTGNSVTYPKEYVDAYNWAYSNGIISEKSIKNANMYGAIPNPSMRAILLDFATYLGRDTDYVARLFEDLFADEGSYANRANFGTALSRVLWGDKYNGGIPYYKNHLEALKTAGLINQINNPESRKEVRGYVLTTLMKASELNTDEVDCDDQLIALACIDPGMSRYDQCPEECRQDGQLVNNLTKTVEYNANEVSRKVVFDGTYTALKDHSLGGITIWLDDYYSDCDNNKRYNEITFYVYIDGEEVEGETGSLVGHSCLGNSYIRFDDIDMKKGKSVQIKIEGELNGVRSKEESYTYRVTFNGSDRNHTLASANLVPVEIVEQDAFIIQPKELEKKVYLKGSNQTIAEFYIKPSKGNSKHLDELVLKIDQARLEDDDIALKINGTEYEFTSSNDGDMHITSQPDIEISSGASVQIVLKHEPEYEDYTIGTELKSINGKSINKTFSKRFVSILAYISKQENKGSYTEFTIGVDKYDDNYSVSSICMLTGSTGAGTCLLREKYANGPFEDGYTFSINNSNVTQPINYITYFMNNSERDGWADSIRIEKKDYPDYFNVNGTERKIYSNGGENSNTDTLQNSYPEEMVEAYQFAYENGITTANTIEKARMYSPLTRIAMAKMLANYAINVLGQQPDNSRGRIQFKDTTNELNQQYDNAVTLAYQLGIMGQNIKSGKFRPNDKVTRAEFVTALSRMLYGTKDGKPYYVNHFEKLKEEGIINNTGNPQAVLLRGYAMVMLMRSVK